MTFTALQTDRLLLRPMRTDDAEPLAARRSDPDVARYQNWTTPYPIERSRAMVADIVAMDGPADGEWWMLTIADLDDTAVLGRPRRPPHVAGSHRRDRLQPGP
jgi:RimJ/RimL family protein N-acetyltransferase